MGLFSFAKTKGHSVALIDIGSASVGGAYVYFADGTKPIIYYTTRVDIEQREGEDIRESMLRSLAFLEKLLIEIGAPALHRETGSGHIESVLVSVAAPWQETTVTTKHIQRTKPFTFTHSLLAEVSADATRPAPGRIESGRSVIATMLNGYETSNPFGKHVKRADIILLSSTLEKEVAESIEQSLRRAFHTHEITLTAFAPAAYAVFRDLYPHQKDFVVLDVSGAATDAAFVKRGCLTGVRSIPHGLRDLTQTVSGKTEQLAGSSALLDPARNSELGKQADEAQRTWLKSLREMIGGFAADRALPRMVFLLVDDNARDYLKRILEQSDLRTLWLSDDPMNIVSVTPAHLAANVKTRGMGEGDLFLAILALYHRKMVSGTHTLLPASTEQVMPEDPLRG